MLVSDSALLAIQLGLVGACVLGLVLVGVRSAFTQFSSRRWKNQREEAPLVLLFENGVLIDADRDATALLGAQDLKDVTWAHVRGVVANRIATIPVSLGNNNDPIRTYPINARPGELRATLEQWNKYAKLSLHNWPTQNKRKAGVRVPVSEFESLTNASMDSPFPIWRMSDQNKVIWANPAFFKECGNRFRLGEHADKMKIRIPDDLKSGESFRVSYDSDHHGSTRHFDITMIANGASRTFFAVNADKAVQADDARRNFVQTLAKTFAQLSTGLAIFDRDRRLVLFNPALLDQFGLPAGFLSGEPTLNAFFDKLRQDRMIPEPRNYGSWRERIMHMVLDATDDRYREIWPLPSGETFRVTGRPHPNGAVAFLFEDISAELSLERRFRAQLDITKAVINNLPSAIAVVSPGGSFSMTNAAFQKMWHVEPDSSIANFTWVDFEKLWQDKVKETLIIGSLSNYLRLYHDRHGWVRELNQESGMILRVQADPIMGGYTILTFHEGTVPVPIDAKKLTTN